ncbi:MAG: hypothetical protein KVP17_001607 [Porospora cf. gigantea B]|uniref:uncharacterized protein n=1 Tax=Porospora cf. gigantea B TaxID=2853592 RepID=UPI003571D778|nr:MAG: hypothetical protein KVP17_001607 [Porospora cf. gigantea B]
MNIDTTSTNTSLMRNHRKAPEAAPTNVNLLQSSAIVRSQCVVLNASEEYSSLEDLIDIQDSVCLLSDTDEQLLLKFTFGVPVTVSEVRRAACRHQIVVTADSPPDVSDVSVAAPSEVQCFANKDGNGIYFRLIYLRSFM